MAELQATISTVIIVFTLTGTWAFSSLQDETHSFVPIDNPVQATNVQKATVNTSASNENRVFNGKSFVPLSKMNYMVAISTTYSDGNRVVCSGFFITSNYVVTAAHCVLEYSSTAKKYEQAETIIASTKHPKVPILKGDYEASTVEEVLFDPGYDVNKDAGTDFALLKVAFSPGNIGVPPLHKTTKGFDIPSFATVQYTGYGTQSPLDNQNRLRIGNMQISYLEDCKAEWNVLHRIGASESDILPTVTDRNICTKASSTPPCLGDAGAPVLYMGTVIAMTVWHDPICGPQWHVINVPMHQIWKFAQSHPKVQVSSA